MKKFDNSMDFENEPSYYVQFIDNFTSEPTGEFYCIAEKQLNKNEYIHKSLGKIIEKDSPVDIYNKARKILNINEDKPATVFVGIPRIDVMNGIVGIKYYKKFYIGFYREGAEVIEEIIEEGII